VCTNKCCFYFYFNFNFNVLIWLLCYWPLPYPCKLKQIPRHSSHIYLFPTHSFYTHSWKKTLLSLIEDGFTQIGIISDSIFHSSIFIETINHRLNRVVDFATPVAAAPAPSTPPAKKEVYRKTNKLLFLSFLFVCVHWFATNELFFFPKNWFGWWGCRVGV